MGSHSAELAIGGRRVGDSEPAYIIAELGINHQGDVEIAERMIREASEAAVDAVKLQKRTMNRLLSRAALEAPYVGPHSFGATYGEHRAALELDRDAYVRLSKCAGDCGVAFLASTWDEESADFLYEIGVPAFKLPSADLVNHRLLRHVAAKGKPIIVSTGMSDVDDITGAMQVLQRHQVHGVGLLQCTSTYPTAFEHINLRAMDWLRRTFPFAVVGYSGHELGIAVSAAAVALGARIVERHFTLDRSWKGGDHAASLEPGGLRRLVRDIRAIEAAMGDGHKRVYDVEVPVLRKLRKSVVTARAVDAGHGLQASDLTVKGPGTGISPDRIDSLVGRRTRVALAADHVINEEDLI